MKRWQDSPEASEIEQIIEQDAEVLANLIDIAAEQVAIEMERNADALNTVARRGKNRAIRQLKLQDEDLYKASVPVLHAADTRIVEDAVALAKVQNGLLFGGAKPISDESVPRVGGGPVPPVPISQTPASCGSICVNSHVYSGLINSNPDIFFNCVKNITGHYECQIRCGLTPAQMAQVEAWQEIYAEKCQPTNEPDCSLPGNPACCTYYCDTLSPHFDNQKCIDYPCGTSDKCCAVIKNAVPLDCVLLGQLVASLGYDQLVCPTKPDENGLYVYAIPDVQCTDAFNWAFMTTAWMEKVPGIQMASVGAYAGQCPGIPPPPPQPPKPLPPKPPQPPDPPCCPTLVKCSEWEMTDVYAAELRTISGKGADCMPPVCDTDTPGYYYFSPGALQWREIYNRYEGVEAWNKRLPSLQALYDSVSPQIKPPPTDEKPDLKPPIYIESMLPEFP